MYKLYTLSPPPIITTSLPSIIDPHFFYGVVSGMFYIWYSYVYDYCH